MISTLRKLALPLLIGTLLVASILSFISLGMIHPVPWIIAISILIIPYVIGSREKRHFVTWKDEYSVGIPSMDDDHRKLLNLINHLQTAIHYQIGDEFEQEALRDLVAYTRHHLKREEDLMAEYNYPGFDEHRKEHQSMIEQAEYFIQQYNLHGHKALEEVADYLRDWLINHISNSDKDYGRFILGQEALQSNS